MPSPTTQSLYQAAVLWPALFYDGYGQRVVSDVAVPLRVKWDEKRSQATDNQGNTITLDATVIVDREIGIGSKMWRGRLEDWPGNTVDGQKVGSDEAIAAAEKRVMIVATYNEVQDVKGRAAMRTVGLQRSQDQLAT